MPKIKSISNSANNKSDSATILIEISPELFERCTRFSVLPETVLREFIENVTYRHQPGWIAADHDKDRADRAKLIMDYMSCVYGSRRSALRRRLDADAARKVSDDAIINHKNN